MDKLTTIDELINKLTSLKMDVSNDVSIMDPYTDSYTKLLILLAKLLKESDTKYEYGVEVNISLLRDYIMDHNNQLINYQLKSFSLTDKNIDRGVYVEMCAIASYLK